MVLNNNETMVHMHEKSLTLSNIWKAHKMVLLYCHFLKLVTLCDFFLLKKADSIQLYNNNLQGIVFLCLYGKPLT